MLMADSALPFAGKVAVVTGSTVGIGFAIALRFACDGASVVVRQVRMDHPGNCWKETPRSPVHVSVCMRLL